LVLLMSQEDFAVGFFDRNAKNRPAEVQKQDE
jgi:hypothetical protein